MQHPGLCLPPGINMTSINMVVMAILMDSLHTFARKALSDGLDSDRGFV